MNPAPSIWVKVAAVVAVSVMAFIFWNSLPSTHGKLPGGSGNDNATGMVASPEGKSDGVSPTIDQLNTKISALEKEVSDLKGAKDPKNIDVRFSEIKKNIKRIDVGMGNRINESRAYNVDIRYIFNLGRGLVSLLVLALGVLAYMIVQLWKSITLMQTQIDEGGSVRRGDQHTLAIDVRKLESRLDAIEGMKLREVLLRQTDLNNGIAVLTQRLDRMQSQVTTKVDDPPVEFERSIQNHELAKPEVSKPLVEAAMIDSITNAFNWAAAKVPATIDNFAQAFGNFGGAILNAKVVDGVIQLHGPASYAPEWKLAAIDFGNDTYAVVPSASYINSFLDSFRRKVDAGLDVEALFQIEVGGGENVTCLRPAVAAKIDGQLRVASAEKGCLSGYTG